MEWRFHNDAPIYAQLVEQLTLRIITTVYSPGQRLPSVRDLAVEAGVNPNTMQRALGELERTGLVFSQRTSGRFVTEDVSRIQDAKEEIAGKKLTAFLADMGVLGYDAETLAELIRQAGDKEEAHDVSDS